MDLFVLILLTVIEHWYCLAIRMTARDLKVTSVQGKPSWANVRWNPPTRPSGQTTGTVGK